MDKLRAMQVFVQIADQGSLTAAARELDTSLPAVVRALAAYESHLGVRLFNRTTRRIALTEEGKRHLDSCRQVLAAVDESEAALAAESRTPTGHLQVTAPVLFGQMYVAPAITRFVQQHPGLRVSVVLLDRMVNLLEEGLDLGIRIGPLDDSSLVALPLGQIRRVVVASPALLRRLGVPAHPDELREAPCIHNNGPEGHLWPFSDGERAFMVAVRGPLQSNLSAPMIDACAAGLGFARALHYQAEPLLRAKKLRIVLAGFETEPWPVHVTYPSARLLNARTRLFVEALKSALVPELRGTA